MVTLDCKGVATLEEVSNKPDTMGAFVRDVRYLPVATRKRRFDSGSFTEGWYDGTWVRFPLLTLESKRCGWLGLLVYLGDRVVRALIQNTRGRTPGGAEMATVKARFLPVLIDIHHH